MEQRNTYKPSKLIVRDITESLGKLPPNYVDLEEVILGALMLEAGAMPIIAGFLKPDHFYLDSHKEIYGAIFNLFSKGEPIDMRTVVAELRQAGKIEVIGGAIYVAGLTSKVSSAANIEYHARLVIEVFIKREVIRIANTIHHNAYEDTQDPFELLDSSTSSLNALADGIIQTGGEIEIAPLTLKVVKKLQSLSVGQLPGLSTGHREMDILLNGLQNGDLILLGGRPGMAKSVLAFQILYFISSTLGLPVGAFSMEMPNEKIITRLIGGISEIEHDKVKKGIGNLTKVELERWMAAADELYKCPYIIDDSPSLHIADIRARAKRMVHKYGIRVLLVDYAQLIRGMMHGDRINRDQEIGVISRGLKSIAKENNIPVIAICSLSREVERRGGDKRPQLPDLRDSSNLESDADVVMFSYRPEVYKITSDESGHSTHGLVEIIVAKHRDGALGTIKLKFIGKYTKFFDWTSDYQPTQRLDQGEYVKEHYKNPLPSEKSEEDFGKDDLPF